MAEDKIFKYKGKTLEELQAMKIEEFSLLLPSSLRRKVNRGFTEQEIKFLDKIKNGVKHIKTHERNLFVMPSMVGVKIGIHNGKEFVDVTIVQEMIGHRFGEFAMTRKIAKHTTMGAKRSVVRK